MKPLGGMQQTLVVGSGFGRHRVEDGVEMMSQSNFDRRVSMVLALFFSYHFELVNLWTKVGVVVKLATRYMR